jgi:hypothetical protein
MRRWTIVTLIAAAAVLLALGAPAAQDAKKAEKGKAREKSGKKAPAGSSRTEVKLIRIQESRVRDLVKPSGKELSPKSTLTLVLELEGDTVRAASHWGKLEITQAIDDRGTSLVPDAAVASSFGTGDRFEELNRNMMWFFEDVKPQDRIRLDIPLAVPPREAKRLEKLEGSLHLAVTEYQDVLVTKPAALVGKKIENAALKAAGAQITLVEFKQQGPVYARLKGIKGVRLVAVHIVDSKGKRIDNGGGSSSSDDVWEAEISGDDPLPPDSRLKFVLVKERKEIPVPFKFAAVPLP